MLSRVALIAVGAAFAMVSGCAVPTEPAEIDESEANVTAAAAPVNVTLSFAPSPSTELGTGYWQVTAHTQVNYTAYVNDAGTNAPVTTGGYVQFYVCYAIPGATSCADRFMRYGDPIPVDSNGQANLVRSPPDNENAFFYFKYLPRGSGYKGATSGTYRVVTPSTI
jgi:hypothetical protein